MSTDHYNKTIEEYAQRITILENERDGWRRAAENMTRQWSKALEERQEWRAKTEALEDWKIIHQGEVTSLNNEINRLLDDDHDNPSGLVHRKMFEQVHEERKAFEQVTKRLLAVIDALMPGARHIAIQDYAELNNAQVDARKLIEK